ncbi:hypothetical protein FYK55_04865 [Roseiconus nitratireducens]|uniref:Uncharacterized protein n=1 Tax=Roseiconus nitratireducens TaxID=2605748 RepID=A0A5M6DF85_9BACT|nr:hypothetical protein [Roseiconus nitratireducens]KAA5546224.1 hypothetical protein FYK55_04865 [Roseiconus nitratireducens]
MTNHRRFSPRTLLILSTVAVLFFTFYFRVRHLRNQAGEHHFAALDSGYQAAAIQRPIDLASEGAHPAPIRMDHETVAEAAPYWQKSMHHARLRDHYLAAARRPWMPVSSLPAQPSPVSVPESAREIEPWWQAKFGDYLANNNCFLSPYMGFSTEDRNLVLIHDLLSEAEFGELAKRFQERLAYDEQLDRLFADSD